MQHSLTIIDKPLYTYDLETYVTCFLFAGKFHGDSECQALKSLTRKNQWQELHQFLSYLKNLDAFMVGYNLLDSTIQFFTMQ